MVLSDVKEVYKIISEELREMKRKYPSERRTQIDVDPEEADDEDLIADEEMMVSMTYTGTIKRIPMDQYRVQKRGGKGLKGGGTRSDEDFVWRIFAANTKTNILSFSDRGKVYWMKVHNIPQGSRTSKGQSISNVVSLSKGELIRAILPVEKYESNHFIVLITEAGTIKKNLNG